MMLTAAIFGVVALVLLMVHLVTVSLYLRRLRPAPSRGVIGQPPVSLLRPVCGLDAFDEETLRSSFLQDYPDWEVIFCAAREDDAAVPLVRRLIAEHPQVPAQLLIGDDRISGNPKLNNLAKGWAAARHPHVCMTDSNLLLPRDYLATLAGAWVPQTGLVSTPPIGIRPGNLGGSLECAFLNGNQARLQFAAASLGQGFAQGKTLLWRRDLLDQAGGLAILGRRLAEDVAATRATRSLGLKVSLPRLPFAQPIGRRSVRAVWDRQLRWSRVRREGFPVIFFAEILNGPALAFLALAVALWLAGLSLFWLWPFVALWYAAEVLLMSRAGWPCAARDIAVLPLRDAMLPVIWFATFARKGFEWRGTAMDAPANAPAAQEDRA